MKMFFENTKNAQAFTLAEVLITLTIIGVIAALTIPNLMQKWEDAETISGVKTAGAIFSNAMKMAIRENDALITDWNWPASAGKYASVHQARGSFFAEKLLPYLKVKTYCGNDISHIQRTDCHSYAKKGGDGGVMYKQLNGGFPSNASWCPNNTNIMGGQMMLENGMTAAVKIRYPRGATTEWTAGMYKPAKDFIGYILVDINGKKGPNQYGIDVFNLPFNGNGLMIDRGLYNLDSSNVEEVTMKSRCNNKSSVGLSCVGWILLHNNVDYKYRNVSVEW